MRDIDVDPAALDPVETASGDELTSLQLGRLRQTLRLVYERVPH